jgi:CRP-like cAMP-binding protein
VDESSSSFLEKFLSRLPAQAVAEFQQLGARRRFPAGTSLFLEGDRAHEVFVLMDGAVKISARIHRSDSCVPGVLRTRVLPDLG